MSWILGFICFVLAGNRRLKRLQFHYATKQKYVALNQKILYLLSENGLKAEKREQLSQDAKVEAKRYKFYFTNKFQVWPKIKTFW